LKLSMKAFCMGLPGAMKCYAAQITMALLAGSLPLSLTTISACRVRSSADPVPRHADAGERGVSHQRQAVVGAIVEHGENAESAEVRELIRHVSNRANPTAGANTGLD
jgi:hypothetical protein